VTRGGDPPSPSPSAPIIIIVVMGVTGAGKTAVGQRLAADLGWRFADADDFHSASSVEAMRRGIPLSDEDRGPWLARLAVAIREWLDHGDRVVLACSALRQVYRDALLLDPARMRLVYLRVSRPVSARRVSGRSGHYMPAVLVDTQFAILEEPAEALTVDAGEPVDRVVSAIRAGLAL
jgi:gluconokinase